MPRKYPITYLSLKFTIKYEIVAGINGKLKLKYGFNTDRFRLGLPIPICEFIIKKPNKSKNALTTISDNNAPNRL